MSRVVIVQARFGSARLPGKALRTLRGRPLLDHVLERAVQIGADRVLLATTSQARDDALVDLAARRAIDVFRAMPEWDVLGRVAGAAAAAGASTIVRLTGDCPLLDPAVSRQVLDAHAGGYTCNVHCGWPDGTDTEVIDATLLADAAAQATDQHDREHVTPYLRARTSIRTVAPPTPDHADDWAWRKWSVDTEEDFARAREILSRVPEGEYTVAASAAAEDRWEAATR